MCVPSNISRNDVPHPSRTLLQKDIFLHKNKVINTPVNKQVAIYKSQSARQ